MAAITAQQTDKGPVFSLPQAGEMTYKLRVQEDGRCTLTSKRGVSHTLQFVSDVLVPIVVRVRAVIVNGRQKLFRLQDFVLAPGASFEVDLRTLGWQEPIKEVGVEITYGETTPQYPTPILRAQIDYSSEPDINVTLQGDPLIPALPKPAKGKGEATTE